MLFHESETRAYVTGHSSGVSFTLADLNADYELHENAVTITEKQFWDAAIKCGLIEDFTCGTIFYRHKNPETVNKLQAMARELGLK